MREYGLPDTPYMMSIYELFHFNVVLGSTPHEKAFENCVKSYREQFGKEPEEFIKYYNERYPKKESK